MLAKSKNKKNPASNVCTDNRRMTGNVNIYICSEANANGQTTGKVTLETQTCIDSSSDANTDRSNSRCVSVGSASLRKRICGIREKRKMQQQPPNSVRNERERSGQDSTFGRNTETWRDKDGRQVNVKISDQGECRDTISSTRDVGCCDADIHRQDSSNFVAPPRDDFQSPPSWIATYSSEARCKFDSDDTDLPLPSVTNVSNTRLDRPKDEECVCGITDSEYTVCDVIDDSGWTLLKSIYTDCNTCLADDSKYREETLRDSVLNRRNDIWEKLGTGYKLSWRRSAKCSQGRQQQQQQQQQQVSTCSCIMEEEENYCTNLDETSTNVEQEIPENLRSTRVICSESARNLPTVRVTSLTNAGDCFVGARMRESISELSECPRVTTGCGTVLENSQEPPKVTRVRNKLVAKAPACDITVCETILAESNEPAEEETVDLQGKPNAPDRVPTICKILDSNFAKRDDIERVSANDANDKLAREKMGNANLNNRQENAVNVKRAAIESNGKSNNVARNLCFNGQQSAEHRESNVPNKRSNESPVSVGTSRDLKPLSRDDDTTQFSQAVELHGRPVYSTDRDTKKTYESLVDREKKERLLFPFQTIGKHFQSGTIVPKSPVKRDSAPTESKDGAAGESKEENDSPETTEPLERYPKDTYRSLRKLLDAIRRHKASRRGFKDGEAKEVNRYNSIKMTKLYDKKDDTRSVSETVDEINNNEIDQRDVGEGVHRRATRSPLAKKHELAGNAVLVERPEPNATGAAVLPGGDGKADISNQTALRTKLSRIIATKKKSHLRPIETAVRSKTRELGTRAVSDKMTERESRRDDEIPPISAKVTAVRVQDVPKDVVDDTPKDVLNENGVSEGVADETTDVRHVRRPRKKVEPVSRKPVHCERGTHFEPDGGSRLVTERTEYNDPPEECCRKYKQPGAKEDEHIDASPTQHPESCSKTDKVIFRSVPPWNRSPGVCVNCRGTWKGCRKTVPIVADPVRNAERASADAAGTDRCNGGAPVSRINGCRRKCERCRGIGRARSREKPMVRLYRDNPRDECIRGASIGKCPRYRLSSDVCECRDGRGNDRIREHVDGRANKSETIRVTRWKPEREIRRFFARKEPEATEDCRCYERPKRQRLRELPYQRFRDAFSNVMNELQQKMSVYCTRCRRSPCRCCCCCSGGRDCGGSQVDPDEGKERTRVDGYVRYAIIATTERTSSTMSDLDRSRRWKKRQWNAK